MSVNLFNYLNDGAGSQARAVVAFLSEYSGVEGSFRDGQYRANPKIARFENCREQGYVISMLDEACKEQINIVFAEHRNTDSIFIIKWLGTTLNSPTLDDIPDDHSWKHDKYYNDGLFDYGDANGAATHIMDMLEDFWRDYRIHH